MPPGQVARGHYPTLTHLVFSGIKDVIHDVFYSDSAWQHYHQSQIHQNLTFICAAMDQLLKPLARLEMSLTDGARGPER